MRIYVLALAILTAANIAQAQPVYYARNVAGSASSGDGGSARAARVLLPTHVTSDAAGNVYVAEAFGRIRKIAPGGTISTIAPRQDGVASGDNGPAASAGISNLFGITVSGEFLYLAQRLPCNIRRVNLTTGIITNFAGNGTCSAGADGPAASTALNYPGAIAADRQGRIYITEGSLVRRIDPASGQIERFAGDGIKGFAGDSGPVVFARLSDPLGLAVDDNNNVYISDTGNCRIRQVTGPGIITTVAGSISCGTAGDGGLAIQAQLSNPVDLALDRTGSQLYIASNGPTIRRLTLATGIIDRFAGTGVAGPVQDNIPSLQADLRSIAGVHVDGNGNVLFADYDGNRVGKVASNGELTTLAGAPSYAGDGGPAQYGFLSMPVEVLVEPGGSLLISESINRRIRRVSPSGVLSTVAGSGAPGPAAGNGGSARNASIAPVALARDGSGNIYTTDALSNTVRRIASNGAISQLGPVFDSTLGGVAVDPLEQYVYVSLTTQHRIVRIALSNGQLEVFAGLGEIGNPGSPGFAGDGGPATQARLRSPQRIFVDADGNLFVADSGNHRIRRITADGDRIETVAGNGLSDFSGDGAAATQASLPSPTGVTVDASGNIIVCNETSVFRVDRATGRMHRIAGQTVRGNSALGVTALQASFNVVNNVSVDARGVIYFAEPFNLRVVALTPSTLPTPAISGIIAPGSFGAGNRITPGGWMEIYGEKLATTTRQWAPADFSAATAPMSLGGVRVTIQGIDAFVQLISPGQINVVVPDGLAFGNVPIEVINSGGTSDTVTMVAAERAGYLLAPPLFSRGGKQYAVGVLPDGAFALPPGLVAGANFRPARSGNRVVLYGVGFGGVTPYLTAGNIAEAQASLPNVKVRLGGQEALLDYAGLAVGFVGLYQFNIRVPSVAPGDALLEITIDGQPITQTLYLAVE